MSLLKWIIIRSNHIKQQTNQYGQRGLPGVGFKLTDNGKL